MIPGWVLRVLEAWQADGRSGAIGVKFRGGQVVHLETNEVVYSPAPAPALCPACGMPMSTRDGGQTYACPCGTKRTLAQLSVKS